MPVDGESEGELTRFIGALGFEQRGRHKSKSVTRWAQGGINIVVNSDNEGFAHSYQISHGPSVCAICLKVDSASATLDRAEKLKDVPFRQPVGPGELEVPSVRGLGGSLLYFVDPLSELRAIWDVDFDPVPPAGGGADAGLTVVDHVSQSMHY